MTERAEEIRRRFEDDPSSDNVFDATDIAILLTALAQAKRERDGARAYIEDFKHSIKRVSDENIGLRAEVERLTIAHNEEIDNKLSEMVRANQAEADLARVRVAQCTCGRCVDHRAALEGRG